MDTVSTVGADEDLVVEPETLLPSQFFSRPMRPPEASLLLAVLEEAVTTYRDTARARSPRRRRLRAEARAWFASDETRSPFSFVNVCDALDLSPSSIRSGLGLRSERRPSRHRPRAPKRHPPAISLRLCAS